MPGTNTGVGKERPLPIHPAARLVPEMERADYLSLVADIRNHGQREAIWVYEGQILDGRHRYRACRELGIQPKTREWTGTGSLIEFVVSVNVNRRHLTHNQRTVLASQIRPLLADEAKQRQLRGKSDTDLGARVHQGGSDIQESFTSTADARQGRSAKQAADATGTSERSLYQFEKVKAEAPELVPLVESNDIAVSTAAALIELPEESRKPIIEEVLADPKVNVRKRVREERQREAEETQAKLEGYIQALDTDGAIARSRRSHVLMQLVRGIMANVRDLDPEECFAILNDMQLSELDTDLFVLKEWIEKLEQRSKAPLRLVGGGRSGH